MSISKDVLKKAAESVSEGTTVDGARKAGSARQVADTARAAVSASFVKELAKICGKAGAAGAVVDGAVGGLQAAKHMRDGTIDSEQAVKHVGAEAGCGFVTSSSGTAGTLAVFMITGSMGPAALAAGMGASMGSRYLYRQAVGETLPSEEELENIRRQAEQAEQTDQGMEDIGPGSHASSSADIEDIGPDAAGSTERSQASSEAPETPRSEGPADESASEDVTSADDDDSGEITEGPWESIGPDA